MQEEAVVNRSKGTAQRLHPKRKGRDLRESLKVRHRLPGAHLLFRARRSNDDSSNKRSQVSARLQMTRLCLLPGDCQ